MRRKILLCISLVSSLFKANGQVLDTVAELDRIVGSLKTATSMGYHYSMRADYPNGETDQISGDLFLDDEHKRLFNNSDAFTLLYNTHCYYRADHRKKTVSILNLEKDVNKKFKKGIEKDVFQNGAMITFLDSVLLKKSIVHLLKKENEILTMKLAFPKGQTLQTMEISFDCRSNLPVSLDMRLFQQTKNSLSGSTSNGIGTQMKCDKFRQVIDSDIPVESTLYVSKKGKIILTKYPNYKLSAQK